MADGVQVVNIMCM